MAILATQLANTANVQLLLPVDPGITPPPAAPPVIDPPPPPPAPLPGGLTPLPVGTGQTLIRLERKSQ